MFDPKKQGASFVLTPVTSLHADQHGGTAFVFSVAPMPLVFMVVWSVLAVGTAISFFLEWRVTSKAR